MTKMIFYGVGAGLLLCALVFGLYTVADDYLGGGLSQAFAQGTGAGDEATVTSEDGSSNGSGVGDGQCNCNCNCGGGFEGRQGFSDGQGMGQRMGQRIGRGMAEGMREGIGRGLRQGIGQGIREGLRDRMREHVDQLPLTAEDWVTLDGQITNLDQNSLTLSTADGGTTVVRLGPEWLWSQQGVTLNVGDEVSVKVFYPEGNEVNLAVAAEITLAEGGQTITLRGEDGRPAWMDQAE